MLLEQAAIQGSVLLEQAGTQEVKSQPGQSGWVYRYVYTQARQTQKAKKLALYQRTRYQLRLSLWAWNLLYHVHQQGYVGEAF